MMRFFFFLNLLFLLNSFVFGQINFEKDVKKNSCSCKNQTAVREYFSQLETQQNFITQCERDAEESRKLSNLPKPKIISGLLTNAISLVKPYYPSIATKLRISGEVLVEVIADENGNVIYSKILKGNAFLRESVRKAACFSKFTPIQYCDRRIKRRLIIKYRFLK